LSTYLKSCDLQSGRAKTDKPQEKKSSELYAQSRLDSTHYTTYRKETEFSVFQLPFTMGKKSKSQSADKSQAPASAGPSLLGGSTLDPTLASLFDTSVCSISQI
jgi:hypothetical protein